MRAVLPFFLLCACQVATPGSPAELPPDIGLRDVTVRQYQGSELRTVITTPELGFHREGPQAGQVLARDVRVETTSDGLRVEAAVVSGDALGGLLTGDRVTARTDAGAVITSPRAAFDRNLGAQGTASTDAGVHMDHPRVTLDATGGTWDLATGHADLEEPRATFHPR